MQVTKSSAAVQTPTFELAVVAGPSPQQEALDAQQPVKELLEPEQAPHQDKGTQDAVEEDAVTVGPRVFSEVGQVCRWGGKQKLGLYWGDYIRLPFQPSYPTAGPECSHSW